MSELNIPLPPAQIVRDYFEKELLSKGRAGDRLPALKDIAERLGVNFTTVRTIVREFAGEGRLEAARGRGTFVKAPLKRENDILRIATNLPDFKSDRDLNWRETIYMGAVRMAAAMHRNISLMPVACRNANPTPKDIHDELRRQMDQIDMLMLFPDPANGEIRCLFEGANKPVVDINQPFMNATTNFVAADYYGSSFRLGRALYSAGRRNFIMVSRPSLSVMPHLSAHASSDASSSNWLRYIGFSEGSGRFQDPEVRFRVIPLEDEGGFQKALLRILVEPREKPDAIFCSLDTGAIQVVQLLREAGLRVPEDVSVAGGTGIFFGAEYGSSLTRVLQPMEQIGANAVRILCHRFDNQCAPVPGIYLTTSIHSGNTTRPEENRFLQQYENSTSA